MNEHDRLTYRPDELIEAMGISRATIYRGIRRGDIPSVKVGGRLLIPAKQFHEWLDNQVRGAA